jgi:hypothetical protein
MVFVCDQCELCRWQSDSVCTGVMWSEVLGEKSHGPTSERRPCGRKRLGERRLGRGCGGKGKAEVAEERGRCDGPKER